MMIWQAMLKRGKGLPRIVFFRARRRDNAFVRGFVASQFLVREPAMLVLSRHRDESIMIGDNVMITIVDIRGDKVRLGIDAPQEIPVHRQEVYDAIKRENEKASRLGPSETKDIGK